MSYFPRVWLPPHAITTRGECGMGGADLGGGVSASAVGASNRAHFVPIALPAPVRAKRLFWLNGSSVSGNADIAIYSHAGSRIVSAGTTAQSGASVLQFIDIADTELPAGNYYLALSADNNTGTFATFPTLSAFANRQFGIGFMATAFVLPATLTFGAGVGNAYFLGIEIGRVV